MKTILSISTVALLLFAASSQCFANLSLQIVSKERAEKELGIKIKTEPLGTNEIVVSLEFSPKDKLEGFSGATFEICPESEYRPLMVAMLKPTIQTKDMVKLSFRVDPAYLSKSRLIIVLDKPAPAGLIKLGSEGHLIDFSLKDSVVLQPKP